MANHTQDGFIVDIDAIQAHGIGAVDISKLKSNGYYTIASVHSATRRNLLKIKGFSEIKVDKVKDAIAKCQVQYYTRSVVECQSLTGIEAFWRGFPDCT
jgi:meiotic recombination protein DMC1